MTTGGPNPGDDPAKKTDPSPTPGDPNPNPGGPGGAVEFSTAQQTKLTEVVNEAVTRAYASNKTATDAKDKEIADLKKQIEGKGPGGDTKETVSLEDHQRALDVARGEGTKGNDDLQRKLKDSHKHQIRSGIMAAASGAHQPSEVADILQARVALEDKGMVVYEPDGKTLSLDKHGNPMTIETLVGKFREERAHHFRPGTGAPGGGGGGGGQGVPNLQNVDGGSNAPLPDFREKFRNLTMAEKAKATPQYLRDLAAMKAG